MRGAGFFLLNRITTAQVSDTTMFNSSTIAGAQKITARMRGS